VRLPVCHQYRHIARRASFRVDADQIGEVAAGLIFRNRSTHVPSHSPADFATLDIASNAAGDVVEIRSAIVEIR
jgi:hypothetical protein